MSSQETGWKRNHDLIPGRGQSFFFLLQTTNTSSGALPISFSVGTRTPSLQARALGWPLTSVHFSDYNWARLDYQLCVPTFYHYSQNSATFWKHLPDNHSFYHIFPTDYKESTIWMLLISTYSEWAEYLKYCKWNNKSIKTDIIYLHISITQKATWKHIKCQVIILIVFTLRTQLRNSPQHWYLKTILQCATFCILPL